MKIVFSSFFIWMLFIGNCLGQNFKQQLSERFFRGYGYEVDFSIYPPTKYSNLIQGEIQLQGVGINVSYFGRLNILQLDESQTFSITAFPSLGISIMSANFIDVFGFGSINLPIELNYNFGAGATRNATEKYGLTLGIGREVRFLPLVLWGTDKSEFDGLERGYKGYSFKAGFLFSKARLIEIFARCSIFSFEREGLIPLFSSAYYPGQQSATVIFGVKFYLK